MYSDEFKEYCNNLAKDNNIKVEDLNEWYYSIWIKGWNSYENIYLFLKDEVKQKHPITSNDMINLYKASIKLRNTVYMYTLYVEELLKSWLFYKKIDKDKKLNVKTIGQLIKLKKVKKYFKDFLFEQNKDENNKDCEKLFKVWKDLRNFACHRSDILFIKIDDLFIKINLLKKFIFLFDEQKFSNKIKEALKNLSEPIKKALKVNYN